MTLADAMSSNPTSRLIDLSMPIVEHWRFPAEFDKSSNVAEGQPFFSTALRMGAHSFTHVDAPRHVRDDAEPLGDVDLSRLWGDAAVIDVSGLGDDTAISADDLDRAGGHVATGDIVILRSLHETRHPTTTKEYWTAAPYVSESAALWLLDRKVRAVAFDFPQDRATRSPYDESFHRHEAGHAEDWACHSILLTAGIPQIEYLTNLDAVTGQRLTFFALPLNLPDADGAPVRAFGLTN